jgi:beta-lactamase regulating signal transducer with metallopeptidase domain
VTTELMPFFIGCALRASVLLGFAWGLTALMRRASASTRHFVWACAMAAAALVPGTMVTVPQWHLPSPAALAPLASMIASSAPDVVAPNPQDANAPRRSTSQPATPDRQARPSSPSTAVQFRSVSYAGIAASVWAAGTTAVLLYMLAGFLIAWRLRRSARRVDTPWVDEAQALARTLEIGVPIACVESTRAPVPIVCGLWRPTIVMPQGAGLWPQERLRIVVLHELAHIKRRDYLTQALAQFICAAYWFNPLAWVAARCLRAERERACDDFVLATGTKGSDYARHLLEIARAMQLGWLPTPAGLAMARRSRLEERLTAILDPEVRRSSALYARLAALAAVLLMSIPVTAVQLKPSATTVSVSSLTDISARGSAQITDFQWSGTLAQGETIEVRGVHGSIRTVTSTNGLIQVNARISNPARVRIDVVQRETGVTICTVLPTPRGNQSECQPGRRASAQGQGRVDFVVQVPAGVRFAGSMIHGDVAIDSPQSDVNVATIDGNIALALAAGQNADFYGNLISGTIDSDFPVHDSTPGLPSGGRPAGPSGPRIVRATIGKGGPALVASTINGDIQLRRR